jgi:hypothetical protein
MPRVTLHPRFARRLPDPFSNSTHGTERHIFFVAVDDLPPGISLNPSPRSPLTRWDVYNEVKASLLNQSGTPGTFHLKNRGITILARNVEKIEDSEYVIDLADGQGIVDGAHTYRLIIEAKQDRSLKLPRQQYVKVEIITQLPQDWVTEVSAGLNTSIQGQRNNLEHLQDALGWIREELSDQRYFKLIAWSEQERGQIDVREILAIMTCFNTASYPNSGSHQPVCAYENRAIVLSSFEEDFKSSGGKAYKRLRPILKDILSLHDIIRLEFPKFHRQQGFQAPELIETSADKPFAFPFLQARANDRLARGALFPALAAFRWLLEDDPAGDAVRWRGGLETALRCWRELAEKFVAQSADRSEEVGRSADAVGKSATHWSMLHKEIALAELTARQPAAARASAPAGDDAAVGKPAVDDAAVGSRGPGGAAARQDEGTGQNPVLQPGA